MELSSFTICLAFVISLLSAGRIDCADVQTEKSCDSNHENSQDDCDPHTQTGCHPQFTISRNASFLDYLNPTILNDTVILDNIKTALIAGKLVKIRNAFIPEFAEYAWNEFAREDLDWQHSTSTNRQDQFYGKHHPSQSLFVLNEKETEFSRGIDDILRVFDHSDSVKLIKDLTNRSTISGGKVMAAPSWYQYGDYSNPHSDWDTQRSVAFLWQLTKDWDPRWGGALIWGQSAAKNIYHYPEYNTLILYGITPFTTHAVTPVTEEALGKRFTFCGWYLSFYRGLSVSAPLEEMFADESERLKLSKKEAEWIVSRMNVDLAENEERKQKLLDLKRKVAKEILYPSDYEHSFILGSSEEQS